MFDVLQALIFTNAQLSVNARNFLLALTEPYLLTKVMNLSFSSFLLV